MAESKSGSTRQTDRILHINPIKEDYGLSQEQLDSLIRACNNSWREFFLFCIGMGTPCIINAINDTPKPFILNLSLFLNYLVGLICVGLAIAFGIKWFQTRNEINDIVTSIKSMPGKSYEFVEDQTESSGNGSSQSEN